MHLACGPQELDEAARRRLPKQLYVPLPCDAARRHMILRQLGPRSSVASSFSDSDIDKIVDKTRGYSGSDMRNLIQVRVDPHPGESQQ
jgi:fidgetin-like protein 1